MNTDIIEKLLRKAPPVRTPPGLLHDLQSDIALPPGESRITNHESLNPTGWFRRWVPALGFALWFLGCIVVFGIQTSRIAELNERNHALQVGSTTAAAEQTVNAEAPNAATAELERLKKDLADVQRLRAEIEQLLVETQELDALRTQNQQLREELKAQAAPPPKPEEDFFASAANGPVRIKCINNLKQVGLAARIWAKDNGDVLPRDYETMKLELATDNVTLCPGDNSTRYEILSPGVDESDPSIVYVRCPIHNNVGLVDGSAQQLGSNRKVVQRDGKWLIGE